MYYKMPGFRAHWNNLNLPNEGAKLSKRWSDVIDLDDFCFGFSLKLSRVYYPWPIRVRILSLLFHKWRHMFNTWQYMDMPGNAWLYMLIRKEGRSHSVMRGQQTYLFTIYINMWTVSSDVSLQRLFYTMAIFFVLAYGNCVRRRKNAS